MPDALTHALPQRVLPLKRHARQGRFGAVHHAGPGVRLSIRHPLSMVMVIARPGKADALSAALQSLLGIALPPQGRWAEGRDASISWSGPDQYLVVAQGRAEGALCASVKQATTGLASVSDQSHGRVMIRIEGPKARALLAKGTPVDLHPKAFGAGRVALTQMAHIGVHLAQVGEDTFELSLFRGFSDHFWDWLTEQAGEFGYEVM